MRSRVSTFGTFSGNIGTDSTRLTAAPHQHLEADQGADRTEWRHRRGQQRAGEDPADACAQDGQRQDDPAEAVPPAEDLLEQVVEPPEPDHEQRAEDERLERGVEADALEVP